MENLPEASVSNCKRLLTVLCGDCDDSLHLSGLGKAQMSGIAEKIEPIAKDKKIVMLSSSALRARESSVIISEKNDCEFREHRRLFEENYSNIFRLVLDCMADADIVILVTHEKQAEKFPGYFAKEYLKEEKPSHAIGSGKMWDLDWREDVVTLDLVAPY